MGYCSNENKLKLMKFGVLLINADFNYSEIAAHINSAKHFKKSEVETKFIRCTRRYTEINWFCWCTVHEA